MVERIGLTATRRLALLGIRIDAQQALTLGIIHQLATGKEDLDQQLATAIKLVMKCAPKANQTTKALLHAVSQQPMDKLLDQAAIDFSDAVADEGREGALAFMQKRVPKWAASGD